MKSLGRSRQAAWGQGSPPAKVAVARAAGEEDFRQALALRVRVFCDEQGVPREIERDDADEVATHALAYADGEVVATGRVVRARSDGSFARLLAAELPGDEARVGRMAVASAARRQGFGEAIIRLLEAEAKAAGLTRASLHAQLHAEGFYARQGYLRVGPEFDEAGIVHVAMRKEL